MKKIGIMSMQRIINYGSYLQAFALKNLIESFGMKVEFIDYKYEKSLVSKKYSIWFKIKKNINIFDYFQKKYYSNKFKNSFIQEFLPLLGVDKVNYNHEIDSLVIGSDEVFNCLQTFPVGYSKNLFGNGYEDKIVVSYAASFGFTSLSQIEQFGIANELGNMLKKFKYISVRDNNSLEIINSLVPAKTIEKNIDPVLAYDFSKYLHDVDYDDYIIIYAYPGRLTRKEEKYIKRFAKKYKKKIISLGSYQKIADEIIIAPPLDVFSFFKKADFVITDTFHGSIFSIITNTNFCTIIRESNKNKLQDLLDTLGQENRIISKIDEIESKYMEKPSYDSTNNIIKKEREKTIEYLKKSLGVK